MDARELRIGNLLYWRNKSNPKKVIAKVFKIKDTESCTKVIAKDIIGRKMDADELEPIPLTEDWLLKFGFKIREDNGLYSVIINDFIRLEVLKIGDEYCNYIAKNNSRDDCFSLKRIKYVHQLQNLYFALAGQELEINVEA